MEGERGEGEGRSVGYRELRQPERWTGNGVEHGVLLYVGREAETLRIYEEQDSKVSNDLVLWVCAFESRGYLDTNRLVGNDDRVA